LLACFLAGLAAGCGRDTDTIPIAVVTPITGQYATFGAHMRNGGELAVTDINAAEGVLGKRLDLQIGDDACDPKQAVAVANHMLGNGCVGRRPNLVQISPASTNPSLTG
jgi:branched-chain amino acid transport system substrate-binding protein